MSKALETGNGLSSNETELEQARETNRRLNRRLGQAESSLTSLIGQAQREVNIAQARTSEAQRLHKLALDGQGHWMRAYQREQAQNERRPFVFFVLAVWAVVASGLALFGG